MQDGIPAEMRAKRRWVVWSYEDRGGKPTKVPYQPDGKRAKTDDSTTWTEYDKASPIAEQHDGIGFVLGGGFAGVDLDDCIDEQGQLAPWALHIVNLLDSYTEISPSDRGLKIFVRGEVPKGVRGLFNGQKVEVYGVGRYFTFTANRWPGTPDNLSEAQAALDQLLADVRNEKTGGSTSTSQVTIPDDVPQGDSRLEQCQQRLAEMPSSVQGDDGSGRLFAACCEIARERLDEDESWEAINYFNEHKCEPPWSHPELEHKWKDARETVQTPEEEFAEELGPVGENDESNSEQRENKPARPKKFNFITSAELDSGDYSVVELIRNTMVEEQPLIIAGPQKSLKTNLLIDAAISLASGAPMLGQLEVVEQVPVAVMSGESGMGAIQETARRVAESKGLQLAGVEKLYWTPTLPNLGEPADAAELAGFLADVGGKVLIVDPAYLTMDGADSANLMAQGRLLAPMREACQSVGATFALAHHTKRESSKPSGSPLQLSDIAWAGFPEFAGQWWLLNRREAYAEGTGSHRLWLSVGSRVGFSSAWALDIDEDTWSRETPRKWDVTLTSRAASLAEGRELKGSTKAAEYRERMLTTLADHPQGEMMSNLRTEARVPHEHAVPLLDALVAEGLADTCKVRLGNNQTGNGFRPKSPDDGSDLYTAA